MRRSIHEIILETFDITEELMRLASLFFTQDFYLTGRSFGAKWISMAQCINLYFHHWPFAGTCLDLNDYIEKLSQDDSYLLNIDPIDLQEYLHRKSMAELLETAFGNVEFFYNMFRFASDMLYADMKIVEIEKIEEKVLVKMNTVLDTIISNIHAKPIELEPNKFILIPNDEEVIAVAELTENIDTSKSILKYNHFKTKGDLEAKKSILRQLYLDIEKNGKRSEAKKDFDYILNNADIRHNTSELNGNAITTYMEDETIEEVYDVAYRLYLLVKLENEYKDKLKDKVEGYKVIQSL